MHLFEMVLRYILAAGEIDRTAFAHRLEMLRSAPHQQTAMTLAEQFREEGRQEGWEKGRQEGQVLGQQRMVIDALETRFEKVPDGLRESIEQIADSARLQALLREAIRCADLDAFAAAL